MSIPTMRPSGGPGYPWQTPVAPWGHVAGQGGQHWQSGSRPPAPGNQPWAGVPIMTSPGMPPTAGWPPHGVARPQGSSRRTWALVGVGGVVVTLVVAIALVAAIAAQTKSSGGTTLSEPATTWTSQTPAPIVPVGSLPKLLLDVTTINSVEGATAMALVADDHPDYPYAGLKTSPLDCEGVAQPAVKSVLQGSGWIGLQAQYVREPGDNLMHGVTQAVISYPTADAANGFFAKQADTWSGCSGKHLTVTGTKNNLIGLTVGNVTNSDGMLRALVNQEGGDGWACQRAMTVRANVVIDVRSCSFNTVDEASTIAGKIGDRVATRA